MFKKKDYLEYLQELYDVEIAMKKEMDDLLKILDNETAIEIAKKIRADEIRHAALVKDLIKLLKA